MKRWYNSLKHDGPIVIEDSKRRRSLDMTIVYNCGQHFKQSWLALRQAWSVHWSKIGDNKGNHSIVQAEKTKGRQKLRQMLSLKLFLRSNSFPHRCTRERLASFGLFFVLFPQNALHSYLAVTVLHTRSVGKGNFAKAGQNILRNTLHLLFSKCTFS